MDIFSEVGCIFGVNHQSSLFGRYYRQHSNFYEGSFVGYICQIVYPPQKYFIFFVLGLGHMIQTVFEREETMLAFGIQKLSPNSPK